MGDVRTLELIAAWKAHCRRAFVWVRLMISHFGFLDGPGAWHAVGSAVIGFPGRQQPSRCGGGLSLRPARFFSAHLRP